MGITRVYRKSGERWIASYNYTDIVEGTGIIIYFAGTGLDATATPVYTLQSTKFFSNDIEIEVETGTLASGGFSLEAEKNYNMTLLNLPLTVRGTAMVNITWAYKGYLAGTSQGYIIIKLIRVRDGVEKIIGTGRTNTLTSALLDYSRRETATLFLDLERTQLKKGDNFRLSIECWAQAVGNVGEAWFAWGQDPKNRDGTIFTPSTEDEITEMQINIPLELVL